MTEAIYPQNIYAYFQSLPDKFIEKTSIVKKVLYALLCLGSIVLIVKPGLASADYSILIRIAAVVLLIVFALAFYAGGTFYVNKQSGGKIAGPVIKKFDISGQSGYTAQAIIELFNNRQYNSLLSIDAAEHGAIQLYVFEDPQGKEFYCQLCQFFSSSDFRGVTPVQTISGTDYNELYKTIKSIKGA